jgi:Tfp pilus assembly protein PilF/predicted Ser/Thr protein kinase
MSSLHKGAKELFIAALERDGADREAFLAVACADDAALRAEVESLLRYHEADSTGLPPPSEPEQPAGPAFAPGFVFANRYRMVTRLGRGGMGDVWRADDLMLETPVALKLIRSTSQAGRERLLQEVRLARRITHPAVVRVFDVGEADDEVFFSMELVEGQDLASVLRHAGRLAPSRSVEIARQLCAGLGAAHSEGVLHRDLKPANVLIDQQGRVRITDFGIAVPAGAPGRSGIAGTPMYMAPEQRVAGASLTAQTDLYALGVVLYEVATGLRPARKDDGSIIPPSQLAPGLDPAFESVILRALSPSPDDRPTSAAAFAAFLPHDAHESPLPPRVAVTPAADRPFWMRAWWFALVAVVVMLVGLVGFLAPRGSKRLTASDTIVLADFANTTSEPLFDGALKVALAVALEQSPFLKVFPDERAQETLRLMERPATERITREVAREIAVREHLKATISGSIASLGRNYVLALEAANAQGDVMAREQVEAASKEEVLTALGTAASRLRERLGESLATLREFDAPLPRATTPSLEALNAYALALDEGRASVRVKAIPHLLRAIELDPNFAMAQAMLSGVYANTSQTALAPAYSKRAFELRDRVSERERYFISWRYYRDALQDWTKALDLARAWTSAYPREAFAFNARGLAAELHGLRPEAESALRTAIELDPRFVPSQGNYGGVLIGLNKIAEAKQQVANAMAEGIDYQVVYRTGYVAALLENDTAGMAKYLELARKTGDVLDMATWETRAQAFHGRLAESHEGVRSAIQQALQLNYNEWAAKYAIEEAEIQAIVGRCAAARQMAQSALEWSRDVSTLDFAARAFAWCGDDRARPIVAEVNQRFPNASLRVNISMPINLAALAFRKGDFAGALDQLDRLKPYEDAPVAKLWPAYLRGQIHAARNDYARATASYTQVIEHRTQSTDSLLYPMSLLGRARAAAAKGDAAAAEQDYQVLFEVWKAADRDLQPLIEARREVARLH